jgi:6-phosphogluconate dehydrogenase
MTNTSTKSSIGVIGLAVMGANLARNFASRGYQTSVFNRSFGRTQELVVDHPDHLVGFEDLEEFVMSLELPRKIIIMVKSGQPVDEMIQELLPYLDDEDMIIDCGNSNWKDTQRRQEELEDRVRFVGCGVSGGSLGALHGPSIMPGGDKEVVEHLLPYLRDVAAKDFQSKPCVANVGAGAAGHFVKMVHNGIEYAIMQGIAEVYDILGTLHVNQEQIRIVFGKLNQGNLQSYLLDITEDILESKTENGGHLLELVLGKAENKGTGGWTAISAIEVGVSVPSLSTALFARYASSYDRLAPVTKVSPLPSIEEVSESVIDAVIKMLELSFFASYLQGLDLIQKASDDFGWGVDLHEVLRIWEGGCIIRSQMISTLQTYLTFDQNTKYDYLKKLGQNIPQVKDLISEMYIPLPVTNASIDHLLTLLAPALPTNLIQAQRDYFGEHTYIRTDTGETVTGGWNKSRG